MAHVEVAHHPRSEGCAAAAAAERSARPTLAATPAALLALQRTAGNRAATAVAKQQLQRAIIAIDGATDTAGQKRATRACLENLTTRKGARAYPGGNARGRVEGPKVIGSIAVGADLLARESEDLYILGHGGADLRTVAGLTPTQLATRIRQWLAPMIAAGKVFVGDIKLVACLSAAGSSPWSGGAVTPYAQALAQALAPLDADDPIQPKFVTGIVGVGWVDETTGKQLSVDLGQYTAGPMTWAPSAAEAAPGQSVDPFQAGDDRATRQTRDPGVVRSAGARSSGGRRGRRGAGAGPRQRADRQAQVPGGRRHGDRIARLHAAADGDGRLADPALAGI